MSQSYPWRRLGELLIERGLLDPYDLEVALAHQRLTGALLGEVLVARGLVSPVDLAAALAALNGVAVEPRPGSGSGARTKGGTSGHPQTGWKPLGRLLVEKGLITESGLQRALVEQRRRGGMLGEILVRRGYVSAQDLAATLAEQHGLGVAPADLVDAPSQPPAARQEVYELHESAGERGQPVHVSESFLEATDVAFDILAERDPEALEIVKVTPEGRETVWRYSRQTAATESACAPERLPHPASQ